MTTLTETTETPTTCGNCGSTELRWYDRAYGAVCPACDVRVTGPWASMATLTETTTIATLHRVVANRDPFQRAPSAPGQPYSLARIAVVLRAVGL